MRLHPFELLEPETLPEALDALYGVDGDTRVVAGGTALVPMLRLGLIRPARLLSLHRISGLSGVRVDGGALDVGAIASLSEVHRAPAVRTGWPLLADAVRSVATPSIRTSGTIGGNLCYAEAASDPAPALLCLDAEVCIAGRNAVRVVPIAQFFRGFYETALDPGEIVTTVRVPPMPAGGRSGYVKFTSRSAEDKPLIGIAAMIVLDPGGRCEEARLGLGGAAPTAIRAPRAETILRGDVLSEATIRAAADAAARDADPLSDLMGSAEYRRQMIRVWVRRLVTVLRERDPAPPAS